MENGTIVLYLGSMFSGKTKRAMQDIFAIDPKLERTVLFQSSWNKRDGGVWKSRSLDYTFPANVIDVSNRNFLEEMEEKSRLAQIVGIDEPFSFDLSLKKDWGKEAKNFRDFILSLKETGKKVFIPSLGNYFNGTPVEIVGEIYSFADRILPCAEAYCSHKISDSSECRRVATNHQRLLNGAPSSYSEPVLVNEGTEGYRYYPVCNDHHIVPGNPWENKK